MNKRRRKKRIKIINERIEFFNKIFINMGRKNGKTLLYKRIIKAIYSKKYKPFKELRKMYENRIIGINWAKGKDCSVLNKIKIRGNKIENIETEIIEGE